MDCTQTSQGLSRTYKISVAATDLEKRLAERIEEMRPQMNLKGFRPGKVPTLHIRKMFGKNLMGDIVQDVIKESSQKAIHDAGIRPASQPEMHMDGDMETVLTGKADLSWHMHVDVVPDFQPVDIDTLTVSRPVAEITPEAVDERLQSVAKANPSYKKRAKTAKAREQDAVIIDFVGKIDGKPFEGGTGEKYTLVLGSGNFVLGFEDQLTGVKAGDNLDVDVTFPQTYRPKHLAGQQAVFSVNVHEVRAPQTPAIDDDLAKGLGLDDLDKLKETVRTTLQHEIDSATRDKVKRNLLDLLDSKHDFDLPPKMVDHEFAQIWKQLQSEMDAGRIDEDDKGKSDDDLKAEYRKIAVRRVRLGLVLAEIGRNAKIEITDNEVKQALVTQARAFPGQEQKVVDFFRKDQGAMAALRAPIYEDKVVDYILEKVKLEDEKISTDTLFNDA